MPRQQSNAYMNVGVVRQASNPYGVSSPPTANNPYAQNIHHQQQQSYNGNVSNPYSANQYASPPQQSQNNPYAPQQQQQQQQQGGNPYAPQTTSNPYMTQQPQQQQNNPYMSQQPVSQNGGASSAANPFR